MALGNPRAAEFSQTSPQPLVGLTGLGETEGPIAANSSKPRFKSIETERCFPITAACPTS